MWFIDTTVQIRRIRDHGAISFHEHTIMTPGFIQVSRTADIRCRAFVHERGRCETPDKMQAGNTSERPAQSGYFGLSTRTSAVLKQVWLVAVNRLRTYRSAINPRTTGLTEFLPMKKLLTHHTMPLQHDR